MRALVAGASGMIGSAVCDALLVRGEEVAGLSRDPSRAHAINPRVAWHRWDATVERPPGAALSGVDVVINVVGEPINQRLTPAAKQRIHDSRVRATKNLVDAVTAAPSPPRALVSQSAIGHYGDRGDAIIDESTPPGSDFLAQLTVEWEHAARDAERAGVRVAMLRSGLVLDPAGGLLKQLLLPFKLGLGGPLAGGRQYMPWIHRDDEAGLLLWAAATEEASGPFNATAPDPVTNRELSRTLARVLRRPAVLPAPKLAVAAIRGAELAEAVTASIRAMPRRALDLGYRFRFTELEPALRDLLRG